MPPPVARFGFGPAVPACQPCHDGRCGDCEGRDGTCECFCVWLEPVLIPSQTPA